MNKKGFTIIELMTTFVLVAIISTLLVKLVITLKEVYINGDMKTTLITKQSTMTDKIYKDLKDKELTKIEKCNESNCINFVYKDSTKKFIIDKVKKTMTYNNYTIKLGKEGYFGEISIDKYNSDIGSILNLKAPLYNKLVKGDYGLNITYQLDNDIEFDNDIAFDVKNTGVTVTFDANGGTVEQTTKQVTVGDNYGKLPIPEREGYEFKGWNGKNMLKAKEEKFILPATTQETKQINVYNDNINLKSNIKYYISYNIDNSSSSNERSTAVLNYNQFYYQSGATNYNLNKGRKIWEFIAPATGDYVLYYWIHSSNVEVSISNFMISTSDNTEYEPYYVTSSTKVTQNKNHTLTAIWEKKESTFLPGPTFNTKLKQLAGDSNPDNTTENTSVTSIKRYNKIPSKKILNNAEVVSTSDSKYPIYAWFNNGTIYYYTEALNPYMNSNAQDMFQNFKNAKSIDVNTIDTSKTIAIQGLFHLNTSLEGLDLSNFNTSNVINMYAPFRNCSSIKSLDLSSFDMSKVTNTSSIISGMTSLTTLKTPKEYPTDSSVTIPLPGTFKDGSNNTYTSLNNTSPKSTTLTKQ